MPVKNILRIIPKRYKRPAVGKNSRLLQCKDGYRKVFYKASYEEIEENDYNLNIPRYVDTFEEEELPDIGTMSDNLDQIEAEERNTRSELYGILGELTGNAADIRHVKNTRA